MRGRFVGCRAWSDDGGGWEVEEGQIDFSAEVRGHWWRGAFTLAAEDEAVS